ncbi:hypothetical protein GW932_01160 [archaeon]|nr:hypothetical protein [archaeon]
MTKSKYKLNLENSIYPPKPIKFSEDMEKDRKLIQYLIKERFDNSTLVEGRGEEINNEIIKKINKKTPIKLDKRNIYYSWNIEAQGATTRDKKGVWHPLTNFYVGNLQEPGTVLNEKGLEKRISPEENFKLIISHEYGHIIFHEFLERDVGINMKKDFSYSNIFWMLPESVSNESNEAYAFWFGDFISGHKSPLDALSYSYQKDGTDFKKVIEQYKKLNELVKIKGVSACFDSKELANILTKHVFSINYS